MQADSSCHRPLLLCLAPLSLGSLCMSFLWGDIKLVICTQIGTSSRAPKDDSCKELERRLSGQVDLGWGPQAAACDYL